MNFERCELKHRFGRGTVDVTLLGGVADVLLMDSSKGRGNLTWHILSLQTVWLNITKNAVIQFRTSPRTNLVRSTVKHAINAIGSETLEAVKHAL
jgi:hypothetical protein